MVSNVPWAMRPCRAFPPFQGDPGIVLAPQNLYGATNIAVQGLNLLRVFFIGLGKLSLKTSASIIAQPRRHQEFEIVLTEITGDGATDVCLNDRLMDM